MTEPLEKESLHSNRSAVFEEGVIREAQTTEKRNGIIQRAGVTREKGRDPSLLTLPAKEESPVRAFILAFVKLTPSQQSRTAICN